MTNKKNEVIQFSGKELIADILEQMPEAQEILMMHGLNCVGCHVNTYETLKEGCFAHGFDEEQFNNLLLDLNEAAQDISLIQRKKIPPFLTEKGKEKILEFQKMQNMEGYGFKIEVTQKPGECDFSYFLDFLKIPEEKDIIITSLGINLFISPKSLNLLNNCEIDFIESENVCISKSPEALFLSEK